MGESSRAAEVIRSIWRQSPADLPELDAECSPTKACRNMKDVGFAGFSEPGEDVAAAWRRTLEREGKRTGTPLGQTLQGDHL